MWNASCWVRTSDLAVNSRTLWPTELTKHVCGAPSGFCPPSSSLEGWHAAITSTALLNRQQQESNLQPLTRA